MRRSGWEFVPDDRDAVTAILAQPHWEVLDSYWGERAELVLDETREWSRASFEPRAAVQFSSPGGRIRGALDLATLRALSGPSRPEDLEVVPDGWDHEHCELCWEKIGLGGQAQGYVSRNANWVCASCYTAFIEPRSLSFIPEG